MYKRICPLPEFSWCQYFFYGYYQFSRKSKFFEIPVLIWWKSCFWGYVMIKLMLFKFLKVLILVPTVYIHKKNDFLEVTFAFSVTPCVKSGCSKPRYYIQAFFDLCVPMNYKIGLVKAQVRKRYMEVGRFCTPPTKIGLKETLHKRCSHVQNQ